MEYLYTEQGWEYIKSRKDGITIKSKTVKGRELEALMVHKKIKISPNIITEVLMDVDHYGDFLSSAGTLKSIPLDNTSLYLDGYQHISNSIPFFEIRDLDIPPYLFFKCAASHGIDVARRDLSIGEKQIAKKNHGTQTTHLFCIVARAKMAIFFSN